MEIFLLFIVFSWSRPWDASREGSDARCLIPRMFHGRKKNHGLAVSRSIFLLFLVLYWSRPSAGSRDGSDTVCLFLIMYHGRAVIHSGSVVLEITSWSRPWDASQEGSDTRCLTACWVTAIDKTMARAWFLLILLVHYAPSVTAVTEITGNLWYILFY